MEAKSPLKQKPLRLPGQSIEEEIDRLINDKIVGYLIYVASFFLLTILEWYSYLMHVPRIPIWYSVVTVLLGIFAWIKIRPLRAQVRALRQGRDGERIVAEQLDILKREGAFIFHDIVGDNFNLDHVIVCEKGIFVVETKTISKKHPRAKIIFDGEKVLVDGYEQDRNPVDQVNAQVNWLKDLLKNMTGRDFDIRGVLVYPGWWVETKNGAKAKSIWVLEPKALPSWIANEQSILSKEDGSLVADRLTLHIRNKTS